MRTCVCVCLCVYVVYFPLFSLSVYVLKVIIVTIWLYSNWLHLIVFMFFVFIFYFALLFFLSFSWLVGLTFLLQNCYLSDFSWRSVIRVRSFLLVYGTISDGSLDSFSIGSTPPLNGKVRFPFEFCSSSDIVPTFRKLYLNDQNFQIEWNDFCVFWKGYWRIITWIGLEMNVYVIGSGDWSVSLVCSSDT